LDKLYSSIYDVRLNLSYGAVTLFRIYRNRAWRFMIIILTTLFSCTQQVIALVWIYLEIW